jgi:hypothetical protein
MQWLKTAIFTEALPSSIVIIYHHHHWLDSPVWALAFFGSFHQSSLSIAIFLQFFTPRALITWITPSSHLSLGLPIVLVPSGLVSNTSLTVLLFSIHICSTQINLLIFNV